MRTLVVVGAGATLAEALPSRPNQAKTPPLDATFFHLCKIARLTGRDAVKRYMTSSYGLDPFTGNVTMEQIFNYIHSTPFPRTHPTTVWTLTGLSSECMWRQFGPLPVTLKAPAIVVSGASPPSPHIDPAGIVAFLTFNQDLVIERSIEKNCCNGKNTQAFPGTSPAVTEPASPVS